MCSLPWLKIVNAESPKPPYLTCMFALSIIFFVCVVAETAEVSGVMDRVKRFYEIEHINSKSRRLS